MNKNKDELSKLKPKIVKILRNRGIKKAGIFGSFVRGEQKKSSDIDIVIEPTDDMSLLGFVDVKFELEDKTGRKVDISTYKSLHPLLRKKILEEEIKVI